MYSKLVSFLFWSQLANGHCNIALEKEENLKHQNVYAHYQSIKRIDPIFVFKDSIICNFSRFHKDKEHFFFSLLIIVFYLGHNGRNNLKKMPQHFLSALIPWFYLYFMFDNS